MLCQKKEQLADMRKYLPKEALQSFDKSFEVEYTHNSTAIEGNTLTLIQTKAVLEDGISVGGKTLREIYEVVNHSKAFQFVKQCVAEGKPLDENTVKDIHALLMENILPAAFIAMWKCASPVRSISLRHQAKCIVRLKDFMQICRIRLK